jgi:hypothetical protein
MEPSKPQQRNLNDLYNVQALKEFDLGNVNFDFDLGLSDKDAETLERDLQKYE